MLSLSKRLNFKTAGILTLLSSIAIGIPLIPTKTPAQTVAICPGLYYEEPWEDILEPPYGCPANEAVLDIEDEEIVIIDEDLVYEEDIALPPTTREVPPLPEVRSDIITTIEPYNGQVEVILDNNTNSIVSYQILGHTGQRWLEDGEQAVLRNVPVPVTITMVREDGGLLQVTPSPADEWAESNNLHVTLDEDLTLDATKGVLRIQSDGNVLLN